MPGYLARLMEASSIPLNPPPTRSVRNRHAAETAALRCLCYAACSELVASPHEMDPRPGLRDRAEPGLLGLHQHPVEIEEHCSRQYGHDEPPNREGEAKRPVRASDMNPHLPSRHSFVTCGVKGYG